MAKIKSFWEKVKKQGKKIAIGLGTAGIVTAATMSLLPPQEISDDYLLKADKTQILASQEVDWIDSITGQNKGKIIKYDYISYKEVGQAENGKLKEDMSQRTGNAQFFLKKEVAVSKTKTIQTWAANFYSGTPFIKQNDKWYQTETATTTIGAFKKQTEVSFFEKMFGVYAESTTTYSGGGDGGMRDPFSGSATWDPPRNADDDNGSNTGTATAGNIAEGNRNNEYYIARGMFPVDTSGLPNNATIASSTFYIYVSTVTVTDGALSLVKSTQANPAALAGADFDAIVGWVDGDAVTAANTLGTITDANVIAGQYCGFALDSDGLAWISLTDWTKLAVMATADATDTPPASQADIPKVLVEFSEHAGTDQDPYLSIVYTVPAVTAIPASNQPILFGDW